MHWFNAPNMLSSFNSKIGNVYCPVYILELLTSVILKVQTINKSKNLNSVPGCPLGLDAQPKI